MPSTLIVDQVIFPTVSNPAPFRQQQTVSAVKNTNVCFTSLSVIGKTIIFVEKQPMFVSPDITFHPMFCNGKKVQFFKSIFNPFL